MASTQTSLLERMAAPFRALASLGNRTEPVANFQTRLAQEIAASPNRSVVLGDNHRDAEVAFEFFRPETAATLAQAGIRHVALEINREVQPHINRFAAGEISRDELAGQLMRLSPNAFGATRIDFIEAAHRHGLSVHAVDPRIGSHAGQESLQHAAATGGDRAVLALRQQDSHRIAEAIHNATGGQPTVVFYGALHAPVIAQNIGATTVYPFGSCASEQVMRQGVGVTGQGWQLAGQTCPAP